MDFNIFLPDTLNIYKNNRINGFAVQITDSLWGIFIIDDKLCRFQQRYVNSDIGYVEITEKHVLNGNIIADGAKSLSISDVRNNNYVSIQIENRKIFVSQLIINSKQLNLETEVRQNIFLFYNHKEFLKSEDLLTLEAKEIDRSINVKSNINQFLILKNLISPNFADSDKDKFDRKINTTTNSCLIIFNMVMYFTNHSKLFLHIINMTKCVNAIGLSIWRKRKISVETGNFLLAFMLDLIFGIVILHWINQHLPDLENNFFIIVEDIISYLKTLLSWLMGSPAGFKLNRTFNNMLGKFFLSNIDLWWKFLEISRDVLKFSLQTFKYMGTFGITFQAAILADLLSFASLHIYCIYIYAARLYNVQISGIIALWRLFLGKKYNPLRGGVDTCHYNHHQLFIGTLGFTMMLFLLPTTIMYYVVFTTFRVIIIILTEILMKTQVNILSLPIYSMILWILRSTKISGNVHITVIQDMTVKSNFVVLLVQLKTVSLSHILKSSKTIQLQPQKNIKWGEIVPKLWRGSLLYSV
ncbi:phosphatidylinositol glycan anchor biosynthesis class Q [Arctopsyche grandis]|uniref:phosphatidylinositol glycan anchor biosynthesis class Q n=1 Tax=Arctopsyche grandis TaxID=121162 RepID=UPI00406D8675